MIAEDENRGLAGWKLWARRSTIPGLRGWLGCNAVRGSGTCGLADSLAVHSSLWRLFGGLDDLVRHTAPDLLQERLRIAPNVKPWNKFLTSVYAILMIALLIPAGLFGVTFVIRTALEDRMLHEELTGYREYAGKVR